MDGQSDLLIASAAKLYSLGVEVEAAREQLRQLVERGIPYASDEMKQAYQRFTELDALWKSLEEEYIKLRDECLPKG